MHYVFTPVFVSTGGLTSNSCIYGHGGVLSGMARKQVFWKGQKAGFLERPENSIYRLQKAWRLVQVLSLSALLEEDSQIRSLQAEFRQALDSFNTERLNLLILFPFGKSVMLSKTLWVLDLAEPITDIYYHSGDSIDSFKRPAVLLLASPITFFLTHKII